MTKGSQIEWVPTDQLTVHPQAKTMPEWASDDERFEALCQDIQASGLQQPLITDMQFRVIDGRHRLRAVKKLGITRVPVSMRDDGQVASVIIGTLLQRRHFTKGQLAYLSYPMFAQAHQEAKQRRLDMLKKGNTFPVSHSVADGKIEDFCALLGVGREIFKQAARIHKAFEHDPEMKAQMEPKILDPDNPIGLGACLAGIAGAAATKGKERVGGGHLDLFGAAWGALKVRSRYWAEFSEDERHEVRTQIAEAVAAMPDELKAEVVAIVRRAAQ